MSVSLVRILMGDLPQSTTFETLGDGVTADFVLPERPLMVGSTTVRVNGKVLDPLTGYLVIEQVGELHLATAPTYEARILAMYQWAQFSDANLQALLDLEGGDARLAAADGLDAIAANTVLLQGRITMLDLTMDGPAMAKALRDTSDQLRKQTDASSEFDIAEMVFGSNANEKRIAEVMRRYAF